MKFLLVFVALIVTLPLPPANAQRVSPYQNHHRWRGIDRVITDAQGRRTPAHAAGKLGFIAVYAPGNAPLCLVEYVAERDEDFASLRNDMARDSAIKMVDKSRGKREDVEAAARAAGFTNVDLDRFLLRVR